ncbi:hypothetical protein KBY55_24735 [Streptomyces sp. b94]|uniref:hypothetical protein n=1 Tax=Streptomyces sp. b94 TaxID=1827634 RepID=UPI001B393740|nr:hypothetical protein [Streptomyces sp. b94]MBQ1099177.1 hypothetical protein [Streptomyces sp. b94]
MPELSPLPVPHARDDETTASRAWAEGLAMTRADTDGTQRSPGELVAAALSAHRTLSRDFGGSVPVTALGPDGAPRGLAAFVAVYAVQREREQRERLDHREQRDHGERREQEQSVWRDWGTRVRRDGRGLGEAV